VQKFFFHPIRFIFTFANVEIYMSVNMVCNLMTCCGNRIFQHSYAEHKAEHKNEILTFFYFNIFKVFSVSFIRQKLKQLYQHFHIRLDKIFLPVQNIQPQKKETPKQ
jgi:uncharacterized protein (DUF486 family)